MTTLTIRDWERNEPVALIDDEGDWEADGPLAETVLEEMLDEDGAAPWRFAAAAEGGSADGEAYVAPGEDGYLWAVADMLPSPLEAEWPDDEEPPDPPSPDKSEEAEELAEASAREKLEAIRGELPARLKDKLF